MENEIVYYYFLVKRGKMLLKWKLKYEDKYSKEF